MTQTDLFARLAKLTKIAKRLSWRFFVALASFALIVNHPLGVAQETHS